MRFLVSSPARMPRLQNASSTRRCCCSRSVSSSSARWCSDSCPRSVRRGSICSRRSATADARRADRARDNLRRALVVSELCVAQILLIGAGLLIRSSINIQSVPVGFDTHNLLAMSTCECRGAVHGRRARRDAVFQEIEDGIAAIPGVKTVGRTQRRRSRAAVGTGRRSAREATAHDAGAAVADMRFVSPNYFAALGLPLLRGRAFTRADGPAGAYTSRSCRATSRRDLWGDADPIGRRIAERRRQELVCEMVGVVGDMHADGQKERAPNELYLSSSQRANPS